MRAKKSGRWEAPAVVPDVGCVNVLRDQDVLLYGRDAGPMCVQNGGKPQNKTLRELT
jgi:hypothetical protein